MDIKKKVTDSVAKGLKNKFMNNNNSERTKHADTIVRNHVIWSMGAGFIPILIADVFAVSALQLDMIRQLSRVYDIDFQETQGKAIVTSLTSSTIARVTAGSLVKLIPGLGSLIGGVTVSIFAGASTYALGEVFKKHFESGGTILDFDPARLKKMYKEKFEKGKKVAEELRKKQKEVEMAADVPQPSEEEIVVETSTVEIKDKVKISKEEKGRAILNELEEISKLKDKGVLTQEEFDKMKDKLIAKFTED